MMCDGSFHGKEWTLEDSDLCERCEKRQLWLQCLLSVIGGVNKIKAQSVSALGCTWFQSYIKFSYQCK